MLPTRFSVPNPDSARNRGFATFRRKLCITAKMPEKPGSAFTVEQSLDLRQTGGQIFLPAAGLGRHGLDHLELLALDEIHASQDALEPLAQAALDLLLHAADAAQRAGRDLRQIVENAVVDGHAPVSFSPSSVRNDHTQDGPPMAVICEIAPPLYVMARAGRQPSSHGRPSSC